MNKYNMLNIASVKFYGEKKLKGEAWDWLGRISILNRRTWKRFLRKVILG